MRNFLFATLILLNIIFAQSQMDFVNKYSLKELVTLFENYVNSGINYNPDTKQSFLTKITPAKKLSDGDGCWLKAIGRGVGKVIHTCKKDMEQSGLLCYPKCRENYTGKFRVFYL